jgi:acylphosphatase
MTRSTDITRLHIHVRGRVQGVGFRAHVEFAARERGLTGWVRNVGYDRVETVAEGERQELERLATAIKSGPPGSRVDDSSIEWLPATGEFERFGVRRSL